MLPILQVGPLAIQTPGLILLLGLWLGISLAERFCTQRGISASMLYNLVFTALIAGIIGGRLTYILRNSAIFMDNPISMISINPGLFSSADGALIGLLAGWVYADRKKLPLWTTIDALTPAFAVLTISTALAHLASGSAFGSPTSLPWAVELWGTARHPSQIYELLAATLILTILWPGRQMVQNWQPGEYFLKFIILSAAARLFLEAFRGDSILSPGGFRLAQLTAFAVLLISLGILRRLSNQTSISKLPENS